MKMYDINNINEIENSLQLNISKLNKYNFPNVYSIAIGKVTIKSHNDEVILYIDETVSKDYMNAWYSSVGRLLYHDLLHNALDNYYIMCYDNVYYLFKLMTDNDKLYCKKKDIKDYNEIIINNDSYVIICVSNDKNFMTADFNVKYANDTINEPDSMIIEDIATDNESIELFNDDIFNNDWDD